MKLPVPARYQDLAGKLLRFGVVGVGVTLVYAAILWAGVEWGGLAPLAATFVAVVGAVALSYVCQKYFTFASDGRHVVELPRFVLTAAVSFAGSLGCMAVVLQQGWDYRWGILLSTLIVPWANFMALYLWVFRESRPS